MNISKSQPRILWVQVLALAGLQAAITLTWLVYNLYLPKLLTQFGFPASLAVGLLVLETALGLILEPVMGGLSDQAVRWVGSRFPLISAGVILAASLFIAIPCVVTFIPPTEVIKGILPLVLIAWALAMTIFRSPAISLLGKYATPKDLPLAASFLGLAGGIVGSFRDIGNTFILGLGPIFAFSIASFVLLLAVFTVRFFAPPETPVNREIFNIPKIPKMSQIPITKLGLIFVTGLSMAWGSRLLMSAISKTLKTQLNTDNITTIMVVISLTLAFIALPAGFLATEIGNRQAMLAGICTTILSIILMLSLGAHFLIILLALAGFSLITNGVIPFILGLMTQRWAGLGIGMYFGEFSLAMSIFGFVFPATITSVFAGFCSALAFLITGVCIMISGKYSNPQLS
ncbi:MULTISPECIES: MFS transporter [Nostocales]|jgi:MFS family permease|uniref:SLC45 family MFS transporter n=2 Tax=Aphanizomenonaceae TaxID=1892259 RepID=A0ACC7S8Z6_DOLFA|nr:MULTISPECIES: MFS transporter [Nostocales]ALB42043.1 MFS transporter [Anabaena sp. WA102]MBD2280115.1 MFS transporter [Aphanizomenon flos-aquae FACHB-1040]MBO1065501.1 SLC45 family MFS transporter [Anabaena sp. 54]MTJ45033.1 SLC45 family MFS transporter [Dolichospermum flos-aquae UHCC 0037]